MTPDEMEHLVDTVQQVLEDLGYEVHAAGSLAEGTAEFELFASDRPRSIVTVTAGTVTGDSGTRTARR